jgi:Zn-dependent protease with chaperone function
MPRREKFTPPGPRLEPDRQPRLFTEIERLAARLNEAAPQEVYLIPEVNAWVAEPRGGGRHIMGIGLPLLQLLTVSQFRAVLAHEFAHYYGGDTRLGPWVYRTRAAMVRTLLGLGRPSTVLRVVTRFALVRLAHFVVTRALIAYWNLFLRITQSISRRQEYRADELACSVAGSRALIEGLQDIHRGAAAVNAYWAELRQAVAAGYRPPIAEGFASFMAAGDVREAVEAQLEKELAHPDTQPFDSHPPLRDRLLAAGRLSVVREPQDDAPAISLIGDLTGVESELLEKLTPNQNVASLKPARWEDIGNEVYVPAWKKYVEEHAELLSGVTAGSLFARVQHLMEMGSGIRDPKGMLLTREQRAQRATDLLAAGFCLALITKGWELHAQPGELYLQCGTHRLYPFDVIRELAATKLTEQAWLERTRFLDIQDLCLGPNRLSGVPSGNAA